MWTKPQNNYDYVDKISKWTNEKISQKTNYVDKISGEIQIIWTRFQTRP